MKAKHIEAILIIVVIKTSFVKLTNVPSAASPKRSKEIINAVNFFIIYLLYVSGLDSSNISDTHINVCEGMFPGLDIPWT